MFGKPMRFFLVSAVLLFVFGFTLVAGVAQASDPCFAWDKKQGWVPVFCDARLNGADIAQPMALYYKYEKGQATNSDGKQYTTQLVTGIEIWTINKNKGEWFAFVPSSTIKPALSSTTNVQFFSQGGITLNYNPSNKKFWATHPSGYTFIWDAPPSATQLKG
jgi:hypothetical protein